MSKTKQQAEPVNDPAFKQLVDLLGTYSEAMCALALMDAEINGSVMCVIDSHMAPFAALQEAATAAEKRIQELALAHPEWFEVRKSLKTPVGTVKQTSGTSLVVENEEVAIALLEAAQRPEFVRTKKELNREALELLSDEELKPFRVKRAVNTDIKVEPSGIKMGHIVKSKAKAAVKEAAEADRKAVAV